MGVLQQHQSRARTFNNITACSAFCLLEHLPNPRHVTQDIVTLQSETVSVGALHSWSVEHHDHVRLQTVSFFLQGSLINLLLTAEVRFIPLQVALQWSQLLGVCNLELCPCRDTICEVGNTIPHSIPLT